MSDVNQALTKFHDNQMNYLNKEVEAARVFWIM